MSTTDASQIESRLEVRAGGLIAHVAISNPARLNSMNSGLMAQFIETIGALATNSDLRALVLTGAGEKAFIGGADIKEMAVLASPDQARIFIARVHDCCVALRDLPVPVIARINGACFGAGLEMAAACDLRVASTTALFGMQEVRLGIPSVIEAALLPTLVGWGRAREILLLGETFDAQRALDWRLVERLAGPDVLDASVETWLESLLACSPGAVRAQKALIRKWEDLPLTAAISAGIDSFAAAFETPEPREAMREFLEREAIRKALR